MSSSTSTRVALVAVSALALVACSDDGSAGATTSAPPRSTTAPDTTDSTSTADDTTATSVADATITSTTSPSPSTARPADPLDTDALQGVLEAAHAELPAGEATVQAALWSPSRDIDWASGGGPDSDAADRPFRMASVGKTVTAATVLQLSARGDLAVDAPIGTLLLPETAALLAGDGYDLDAITVRHLLTHTGGVYDYAFGDGSPFLQQALADRGRRWTRQEQVELAVTVGDPLWPAGTGFAYSDTGYVLLGEIVEGVTGAPYHEAARDLLGFSELGLDHLWLEAFEPAPADLPAISRSFLMADEVSDLDFSLDGFGGGGYAGTPRDVARFFGLLFAGDVIDPDALDVLRTVPETNAGQEEFGVLLGDGAHGVYRMEIDGRECWSHRGFLGTIALACPDDDLALVVTTNTALTDPLTTAASLLAIAAG
jgi:D-alanyl-D-alanine carboxypeptidase